MTTKFIIRDFRAEDFPKITNLWAATDLGGSIRGDNALVIARTLAHGGIFLVMEDKSAGEILGTSWMTNDSRRIYLHHFGIAPSHQNQGLGKVLLKASLDLVRDSGLQIKLEVHRNNKAAIALYRGFGFTNLGDYDSYIIRDLANLSF